MSASLLLGFLGVCIVLTMTPGPDSFLVLRYAIGSRAAGIAAALGSALGGLVWAFVVAVGVATLLEESATAFRLVKLAGGIYLIVLGIRAFADHRRARRQRRAAIDTLAADIAEDTEHRTATRRSAFLAGLLSTLFNPKVGLFYLVVVPQFLTTVTFGHTLVLGVVESSVAAIDLVLLAAATARAVTLLRRPRVRDRLEQLTAGVLAALGIGTSVSALS